jgi:cytoskeletal protein RodZ
MAQDRRLKLAGSRMMSAADHAMHEDASDSAGLGAELRAAREKLGWSLGDLSANLRIEHADLQALEEGRIAELPRSVHATGFLRLYAKLLDLDPGEVARRLRAESEAARPGTQPAPAAQVPRRGGAAWAMVLVSAVLASGAYVAWQHVSGERPGTAPAAASESALRNGAEESPKLQPLHAAATPARCRRPRQVSRRCC